MGRTAIVALRVLLVVVLAGSLGGQLWFFPTLADGIAYAHPELAWLQWPMLGAVILAILVGQLALVAIWILLSMVERGSVFSAEAFRWVNVIIAAGAIDAALILAVNAFLTLQVRANPPVMVLFMLALTVAGAAFTCLMIVMKGLLRMALILKTELSEVI
ncbi:MAG: DUF2975 domain-containing protein [Micropruina sp.]